MSLPEVEFDFIIVGAGSRVVCWANRLTADGVTRVLLLEAGGHDRNLWIHIPAGFYKMLFDPALHWVMETESVPDSMIVKFFGLMERSWVERARSMVCSTSADNGRLRRLAAEGQLRWSFDDILPYFKKSEDQERGASDYHGVGGPLTVSDCRDNHPLHDAAH